MKQKESKKDDNNLYVGIDLGTSRSAISASNGTREWIESFVGWPKDFISQQVVGKKVLFGSAALEHRLSLDVCRPLQHGVIKEGIETGSFDNKLDPKITVQAAIGMSNWVYKWASPEGRLKFSQISDMFEDIFTDGIIKKKK